MNETLKFIALYLNVWVIFCVCLYGFLVLNSKSFVPWRQRFSKILKDPKAFDHFKEMNEIREELHKRPEDFLDGWSIAVILLFFVSFLLVITALLVRFFGS